MNTILIVGCGYLGIRVARRLVGRGDRVIGTVRRIERAKTLTADGIEPLVLDVLDPASRDDWPEVDAAVYCVGYDRSSKVSKRTLYVEGPRNVLDGARLRTGRLVYTSSTGVYGQMDGSWVDENSPTQPMGISGQIVLEGERTVEEIAASQGFESITLRFSGLYGPGRLPRRSHLERGEPIPGDPEHWLNLIEIEDAATCVLAALDHPSPPSRLYIASDDRPVRRLEFYTALAECLGTPTPIFSTHAMMEGEFSRDATNKRVSNRRIKAELDVSLRHPGIISGLPAVLSESRKGSG